jgi:Zn-finger nucleic acid-binding protein
MKVKASPRCPRCQSPLSDRRKAGWGIGWCHRCEGLWLDAAALGEVERSVGAPVLLAEDGGDSAGAVPPCALCGGAMSARRFGRTLGISVDACPGHGVWVDGDELLQLAASIQEGLAERECPPEHEHRALAAAFAPVFELLGCA